MAKRGRRPRMVSIDSLMFELGKLEGRRREIVSQIRKAMTGIGVALRDGEAPFPLGEIARSAKKTVKKKMSAEARAKISAAQKARWAKVAKKAVRKAARAVKA